MPYLQYGHVTTMLCDLKEIHSVALRIRRREVPYESADIGCWVGQENICKAAGRKCAVGSIFIPSRKPH